MNDDLKLMLSAQTQLWDIIMSYPEEDRLKVAGVSLKVTIQLYQTMLNTETLEKIFEYALNNLPENPPALNEKFVRGRTIH
tara:strand:- start:2632 stop:2874 length:243 start_codon:yes stop_codon:yes gene_type:complete